MSPGVKYIYHTAENECLSQLDIPVMSAVIKGENVHSTVVLQLA